MYLLYNFLLLSLLILASPFWIYKVLTKEKHRKGFFEKFGIASPNPPIPPLKKGGIHIHAVSVGEVVAAIPFIKELKKTHPKLRLVLSTVTPTGREVACKRLPEVDQIVYFPFDLPWSVRRFLQRIRPDLFISVETELWPNFLRQVKLSGARTLIINGRISPHTFKGYSRIRPFMKKVLAYVDLFCMQSEEDARRIRAIGAPEEAIQVTGNMKYDQGFVDIDKQVLREKRELFWIKEGDRVIIAGSTHRGEDEIILEAYKKCRNEHDFPPLEKRGKGGFDQGFSSEASMSPDSQRSMKIEGGVIARAEGPKQSLNVAGFGIASHPPDARNDNAEGFPDEKIRLIIVPRHPERTGEIEELVRRQGLEPTRRTALVSSGENNIPHDTVIVVDTIGELATLYSLATIVIIGGSFIPHGGQNPLEALYYRRPVIFGEHMFNFREIAEEILRCGAGMRVKSGEELSEALRGLLHDSGRQREMGEKGYQIIIRNKGAVERNLAIVEEYLPTIIS